MFDLSTPSFYSASWQGNPEVRKMVFGEQIARGKGKHADILIMENGVSVQIIPVTVLQE